MWSWGDHVGLPGPCGHLSWVEGLAESNWTNLWLECCPWEGEGVHEFPRLASGAEKLGEGDNVAAGQETGLNTGCSESRGTVEEVVERRGCPQGQP